MSFERHYEPRTPEPRRLIRHYTSFEADVGCATVVRAAPVRPQQFLQLVLEGDHKLHNIESGRVVRSAECSLIGLCTYRKYNLIVEGRLRLFFVQFLPGALHAMTGLDMSGLTNGCRDAAEVLGDKVEELRAQLAATETPEQQVGVADAWFAAREPVTLDSVSAIAGKLRNGVSDSLARQSLTGLSERQYQRRFARQIGVTPKVYARLCRLSAALDMREGDPGLSWTELAHAAGYADQAHLTREFRAFVRAAPSRFNGVEVAMSGLAA